MQHEYRMSAYLTAVLIVIVVVLVWMCYTQEGFWPCNYCDTYSPLKSPPVVLNPYVWPYSGTGAVEDIYIHELDNPGVKSMYNQFTPDHSLKTE